MRYIPFLIVLLLFPLINTTAQNSRVDSLKKVIRETREDTVKIETLVMLGNEIEHTNPDSAILEGKKALALSRSISWGKGVVLSEHCLGTYYEIKGDEISDLAMQDSALASSKKYNYLKKLGSIYNELGNIASDESNYPSALGYYFKALSIDSLEGKQVMAGLYNNIGLDYQEMGNYVRAEEYYLKTEKIDEEENNREDLANIYGNLGVLYYLQNNFKKGLEINFKAYALDSSLAKEGKLIPDYQNIGLGYFYLGDYPTAMAYYLKGISLAEKTGEKDNYQRALSSIAEIFLNAYKVDSACKGFTYTRAGNKVYITHSALPDSAFLYEKNCIAVVNANIPNDMASLMMANKGIGDVYSIRKDYRLALQYYQGAYTMADSLNVLQQKMEFSALLGHTLAKTGNYPLALKYLDNASSLKDTLFGKEKSRQMAEMEAKYQNEKNEKEIETLAQKNEIQNLQIKQSRYAIFGLAALVLLIGVIAFLLIRQNRINAQRAKIEMEQKLLRSQMNPHFIFNAITSIQNFIYNEEPKTAANYLSSVFRLMRSIIESSKKEYVLLEKEMSALRDYLILQQLTFRDKFDFTIDIDHEIDLENTLIPPMLAQPFIENAIQHGILNNPLEKGKLQIRLCTDDGMILLDIEDNGIGRERAKEISDKKKGSHLSVATGITSERIALLNKNSARKMEMEIVDLKNDKNEGIGTKVVLRIPLKTRADT